jgi:hypothetical protein
MMSWIDTVPYEEATGKLRLLYDRVKGPDNNVDNIMMMHSLRPHSMEGHMAIYKYVLHHSGNTIPKWFLETLGVWVSAYFSYANRTVLGLGCSTKGDILGLSPNKSDDPSDWSHT